MAKPKITSESDPVEALKRFQVFIEQLSSDYHHFSGLMLAAYAEIQMLRQSQLELLSALGCPPASSELADIVLAAKQFRALATAPPDTKTN